jgi:hypothetical protein
MRIFFQLCFYFLNEKFISEKYKYLQLGLAYTAVWTVFVNPKIMLSTSENKGFTCVEPSIPKPDWIQKLKIKMHHGCWITTLFFLDHVGTAVPQWLRLDSTWKGSLKKNAVFSNTYWKIWWCRCFENNVRFVLFVNL